MTTTSASSGIYPVNDFKVIKEKVLNWLQQFNTFSFLDNHQYQMVPHSMECLLAAGIKKSIKVNAGNALEQLDAFMHQSDQHGQTGNWLFGHLAYDLKNEIEDLTSSKKTGIAFPDLFFFEPEIIIRLTEDKIIIESDNHKEIFNEVINTTVGNSSIVSKLPVIKNKISKEDYIDTIKKLQQHILRGDCYEINFCQEFYDEAVTIDPVTVYKKLSEVSPNPFSALYRMDDQWLICASPERFLKKQGTAILSQPIKGTSKRDSDQKKDILSKDALFNSEKDRSENVMVVDLVRNDLAKICKQGSVKVDELYGVYSFPQVHQMISTVSGEIDPTISFVDIIKATFPMGSMTGAPKQRVMQLIEEYEKSRRGIFAGAVGYITPDGDFDFNVVIRSIMYNAASGYLSFQTGSAITFYSDPEKEWEECLLKATAIKTVLERK